VRAFVAFIAIASLAACASSPRATSDSPPAEPAPAPQAAAAAQTPPPPTTDLTVAGRRLAEWILANQIDSVIAHLETPEDSAQVRAELNRVVQDLAIRGGREVQLVGERIVRRNKQYQYWRTAEFEHAPSTVLFRIVVSPDGEFMGVGMGLANNPPPTDP
jgi:hypothetical protein